MRARGARKTGSRRGRIPTGDKSERWLVSYADFITLLFAFFVVLFAASDIDRANMARLVEAYARHLPGYSPPPASHGAEIEAASGESKSPGPIEELEAVKERLEQKLAAMVEDGKVSVTLQPRGLVLSLQEAAFFPIGRASFSNRRGRPARRGRSSRGGDRRPADSTRRAHRRRAYPQPRIRLQLGTVELASYRGDETADRPLRRPA